MSSGVRVTVIGTGYVGLSIALLLAPRNRVAALDIDADRIRGLRAGRSPIADPEVTAALDRNDLEVEFTVDPAAALTDAEYVVIATPTDYDDTTNSFNTGTV
ncbi:MAG TPA: UDP-glucose 6-dehydrogenase, partial [Microlunatus sp.]|nr:UDP-glucose 6-dehydrogenase [Microlunatus sp.]